MPAFSLLAFVFRPAAVVLAVLVLSGCAVMGGKAPSETIDPATRERLSALEAPPAPAPVEPEMVETGVQSTPTHDPDPVMLDVNGHQIRLFEYREGYRAFLKTNGNALSHPDAEGAYRRRLIDDLLLYDYGRRVGIDQGADYLARRRMLERKLVVDTVVEKRILSQVVVSPEEIQRYYEENASEFATPRRVQIRAILLDNFEEAKSLREQLERNPNRFAELAAKYSKHQPSRDLGGLWDAFPENTYSKALEDVAFNLDIGELSPVIATEQGFFLIEKTAEIPEKRPPLDEIRGKIEERIRTRKTEEILSRFLESLRQYGVVEARWDLEP